MKKVLFLLGLFTLCATVTFAQERTKPIARKKPSSWRDDSLLWVKKPTTATIKSPGTKGDKDAQKLGNFEIQDVKAPEDKQQLGNFEIQDLAKPDDKNRDSGSGQTTGRRVHKPVRRKPN